jgi:hypothetical protein
LPPDLYLDEFRALLQGMQHCNIENLQLANVGMGAKGVSTLAEYITDMAAIIEVNCSSNPTIGSVTGLRDTRDGSMIAAVAVKKGVFATDGSRWGEVNGDPDSDGEVKLNWLDDGSESGYTKANTLIAVSDKGLIEYAEAVFGGIEALCTGLPNTSIQRLNLSEIGLTPDGLTRLAILFTSNTTFTAALSTLNLRDNGAIEAADIEAVKIAAPNVSIEH